MGKREAAKKKLRSWLGRKGTDKLESHLELGIHRIRVLRNKKKSLWEQARGDVAELLRLGYHDRALIRAENIIREQNMVDAFDMLEGYCELLLERVHLLENQRECPDELREALCGMIYASSRIGQLPELEEVRSIIASMMGKEFTSSAIELRNKTAVNPIIIQKLSTRHPTLEIRRKIAEDIGAELGISLHLRDEPPHSTPVQQEPIITSSATVFPSEEEKMREKYKDAASAAQAASESAAYAAAAARVAAELATSESSSHGGRPGDLYHSHVLSSVSSKVTEMDDGKAEKEEHKEDGTISR